MYLPPCGGTERALCNSSHGALLSLKRPNQDRRDLGVSAGVGGGGGVEGIVQMLPRGPPIPQMAQAGPEGLGCFRCSWGGGEGKAQVLPRGVPIPQASQAGPQGLGCIRRCVGALETQFKSNNF